MKWTGAAVIEKQYLNDQVKKEMMMMRGPFFKKMVYSEFSSVAMTEFAKSSPHSAF